ncbi:MAG: hypothetical protein GY934_15615 [Gammaproteobacteria bacterium]|nr:hypothetical protein [Gammaproteobacteria bacterium]
MAFLFLAVIASQTLTAAPIATMGEAINKAGRQRMLTQRMVKAYAQMGQDISYLVAEKQLAAAVDLFDAQLAELKAYSSTPDTEQGLKKVSKLWGPVKNAVLKKPERDQTEALRANAEMLLAAAHQVVLKFTAQSGTNQGHLVNIAGRQRMLSQRMGNLYMLRSWGFNNPEYLEDYKLAVSDFDNALQELSSSNDNTQEIRDALADVAANWKVFKLSNQMEEGKYIPTLVTRMLDKILGQMNEITGMYAALPQ